MLSTMEDFSFIMTPCLHMWTQTTHPTPSTFHINNLPSATSKHTVLEGPQQDRDKKEDCRPWEWAWGGLYKECQDQGSGMWCTSGSRATGLSLCWP